MREVLKSIVFALASLAVVPELLSYRLRSLVVGGDRALEGSSQLLGMCPGLVGQFVRRAFLCRVLASCDRSVTVEFGTLFSQSGARLERNAYVGPRCHLGLVHVEEDVLIGAGVHIPSGSQTHGTGDVETPIRMQGGTRRVVRIGRGAWIGSAAVVMADVGRHAIVGAGAVVVSPVPDYAVAVGVPARVVRSRRDCTADEAATTAVRL